jgi:hypothetical protein
VFDEEARDKLLDMNYKLLKRDEKNHIYVFVNESREVFALDGINHILSDTITF